MTAMVFAGSFRGNRALAALANGAREQVALDGVLVAGRQLLDGASAAVEVAAIVDKHARSPSGRGVEGDLRLDSSGAPEEAHALLARDLGAAGEYAAKNYLTENLRCTLTEVEGKIAELELPPAVDLKVLEAPPGIRGDTATNVTKQAKVETGIEEIGRPS